MHIEPHPPTAALAAHHRRQGQQRFRSGRRRLALFLLFLLPWVHAFAAQAQRGNDHLTLLTLDNPPLTFRQNGAEQGLSVAIIKAIQKKVGNDDSIVELPWPRAYSMALAQPNIALFTTMRTPIRESLFRWVGPITVFDGGLFVRQGSNIHLTSLEQAKALPRITVVRNWYLEQNLKAMGFRNLEAVNTTALLIKMLAENHTQVIAAEDVTIYDQIRRMGYAPVVLQKSLMFSRDYGYIAFSRGTPERTIADWQQALAQMKRDGSFAAIYHRWLPGEPIPRR